MASPKTRPTRASVAEFIRSLPDQKARTESLALVRLMRRVTRKQPRLWGTGIVGFGTHVYRGASGRAEWPLAAFSPRKNARVVYVMSGLARHQPLLARLGRFKTGKGCLYLRSLDDVDLRVLEALVAESVALLDKSGDEAR